MARKKAAAGDAPAIVYRDIRELKNYPRNARTHPREQIEILKAGLREYGWTRPILIDEADGLVAGHGIKIAAWELWENGEQIPRTPRPWFAPTISCEGWTDAQKRAYILFDNRSAELSGWDDGLRAIELQELREQGFDLTLTGHDEAFVQDLIAKINEMNEPPPEDLAGDDSGKIGTKYEVIVECANEGQQAALLERLLKEGYQCRALVG